MAGEACPEGRGPAIHVLQRASEIGRAKVDVDGGAKDRRLQAASEEGGGTARRPAQLRRRPVAADAAGGTEAADDASSHSERATREIEAAREQAAMAAEPDCAVQQIQMLARLVGHRTGNGDRAARVVALRRDRRSPGRRPSCRRLRGDRSNHAPTRIEKQADDDRHLKPDSQPRIHLRGRLWVGGAPCGAVAAKCRCQDWSRPPGPHRPREWGTMVRNNQVPPDTSLQTDRSEPGGPPRVRVANTTRRTTNSHLKEGLHSMQNTLDNRERKRSSKGRRGWWGQDAMGVGGPRRPRRSAAPRDVAGLLTQIERWKAEAQRAGRPVLV